MKNYVVGFLFDAEYKRVVLIKKTKPKWQNGKLNGVGGKIEEFESPRKAMAREFAEETGMVTSQREWNHFLTLTGPDFRIWCYYATSDDITAVRTMTEEDVVVIDVDLVVDQPTIPNIPWMVAMAQSFKRGERATRFIVHEVHERA